MTDQMDLAVFEPIKAVGAELLRKDGAQEFDHTTPEGEKALRSWVQRVRGYKADIERCRVAAKAVSVEYGRKVDDIARELTLMPVKIITDRMKPLDEIEDAKRAKAEAIVEAERVTAVKAEADRIAGLKRREAKVAAMEAKIKAAEDAANAETAKAEQAEREKKIAAEATATATRQAEAKAEGVAVAKERDRLDEIESAKAVARMDAEVERRRVSDEQHRRNIETAVHKAIWDALDKMNFNTNDSWNRRAQLAAVKVRDAIKYNKIPHVTINY